MHSSRARRVAVPATAVLLVAVLTGCGSEAKENENTAPKASLLSEPEATAALMTLENLGGQFKLDTEADHSSPAPGCLTAFDDFTDKTEAPTNALRDFTADTETGFPLISSQVQSYETVAAAEKVIEELRTAMAECTVVDDAGSDGVTTKLEVGTDDEKSFDDVDDQINITATGSIAGEGQDSPLGLWLAAMRVGNNITLVTVGDLAVESPGEIDELVEVANDRLAAVMDGEQPDDSAVAGG